MSSYEINAPVDFTNTGEVQVTFSNTLATQVWAQSTSSDSMVLGSTTTPNVMQLDPDGTVNANVLRLRSGALGIKHKADPGLVSNYDFNWPANPPTGDGQFPISSGATNVFYDIHAQNTIFVRKNPGPGEFSSVAAAAASVSGATDTNRFLIWVYPGIYSEPNFTIPAFTYVVGVSMQNFIMEPSGSGAPFVSFSNNTGLAFASVRNTDPNYPALYFLNVGDYALTHKTEFENCPQCVLIETDASATEGSQVYLEYMGTTDSLAYATRVLDSGSSFENFVSIENFFTTGHSDDGLLLDGPQVEVVSQSTVMQSDSTGTAFRLLNGCRLDLRGTYIEDWTKGIWVENTPGTPTVIAEGVIYENISQNNILIENTSTVGYNDGYTQYSLTSIPYVSPFFVAGKDQRIVTVAKKGADFTSVAAAVAYISDNSVNNRYTVYVGPGVFVEPNIQMKSFVSIIGFYKTQTILMPSSAVGPFITGASYSTLSNLMLKGDNSSYAPTLASLAIKFDGDPSGAHFRTEDLVFDSFVKLCEITSDLGLCIFLLLSPLINMQSRFTTGFTFEDSNVTFQPVFFYVNDGFWNPDAVGLTNFSSLFEVTSNFSGPGQNVYGVVQSSAFGHQPMYPEQGTAFTVSGASNVLVASTSVAGFQKCFYIPNVAAPTILSLTSVSCIASNTQDVDIQNPSASGSISGSFDYTKINIVTGANFGVSINDPDGNIALGGQIYQGEDWSLITNITEQIQHASTTGQVDGPNVLTSLGGFNINVPGGRGYVFLGPISANYLKYITWSTTSLTLAPSSLSWVYVDGNELVQANIAIPSHIENVILGTVRTDTTGITYIQDIGTNINNLSSEIDDTLRNVFGPIVKSGVIGSPGSNLLAREVQISSGQYNLSTLEYFPPSQDPISMLGYYNSGNSEVPLFTNVPLQYDNAGVLTAIPSGQWAKHAVYVLTSLAGTSQYFLVYAQQLYASEALTVDGNLPAPPPFFLGNMCPFTAVIVSGDDTNAQLSITRFLDIRPTLSFTASSATATLDHNSLLNLTVGNPHTQYFLIDGSEPMAGNFDLDGYNILGSGGNLIFGMDILSHASRHVPGGADPLPTAAPVTISATSNQEGVAASFSRSDHLHAHGAQTDPTLHAIATPSANGFMSSSDKAKLDDATSAPTANTLVIRDASSYISSRGLTLYNTAGSFYANILPSPATFTGPNHTLSVPIPLTDDTFAMVGVAQTLTNKTITDSASNVYSRSFFVGPSASVSTDSAGVPTAGQVLYASSTSSAGWVTVDNSFLAGQGVSFTVSPGSGLSGGGSVSPGGSVSLSVNGVSSFVGNRVVLSTATGFVEASALADGQLVIGRTGLSPVVGSLTSTLTTITVTPGVGTLNVDLPNVVAGGSFTFPSSLTVDNFGRITSITSGGSGGGTVTSVGLSMPAIFSVTNSPVTTSGTLTVTSNTQLANTFYAGPTTGPAAIPTFRSIGTSDLPQIDLSGSGVTGTLPVVRGGTGATSFTGNSVIISNGAGTALTSLTASANGQIVIGSASGAPVFASLGVTSPITSTPGPGSLTIGLGVVPIANGGTGLSSVPTNNQILIGDGLGSYILSTLTAGTNISVVTSLGTTTISLSGTVTVPNGGTGVSSFTANSVVISGSTPTSNLATVTLGNAELLIGSATSPVRTTITGTSPINVSYVAGAPGTITVALTGIVPVANGGTGATSFTGNSVVISNAGGTALTALNLAPNQIVVGTAGAPTTGSLSGTTNQINVSSGPNFTSSLSSTLVLPGSLSLSTSAAVAAAGITQGTATQLTSTFNVVTSSTPGVSTGVRLPTASVGLLVTVSNRSGNTIIVYPQAASLIDNVTNAAVNLPNLVSLTFEAYTATQWVSLTRSINGSTNISVTNTPGTYTLSLTGTVPVSNGGTGTASLTGNGVVTVNAGGTALVSNVLTNGQLLIGFTGAAPSAATLTAGTAIGITNAAGSITIAVTTVPVANGGTGVTSFTANGIFVANAAGTALTFPTLANGQLLIGSTGLAPVVGSITGTSPITVTGGAGTITVALSTVPVASGGTGVTSFPANSVIISSSPGTNPLSSVTFSNTNQVLAYDGTAPVAGSITGTANQIDVTTGPNFVSSISSALALPGSLSVSTANNLTATGASSATALQLSSTYNIVTTVPAVSGVKLPVVTSSTVGMVVTIVNKGANPVIVYPNTGATIDGLGSVNVSNGSTLTFAAASTILWYITVRQVLAISPLSATLGSGATSISLTGTVPVANGGTGVTTTPTNGQLLIGNGSGYALSTLTAGSGVSITNGAGSIQISASGSSAFTTCLYAVQLVVISPVALTFAYFPWPSAYTTTYTTTRTVRFWLDITNVTKGITLTVTYGPTNINILTYTNTAITSGLISQTFTAPPVADTYLSFAVARSGGGLGGANSASIKGITLVLA